MNMDTSQMPAQALTLPALVGTMSLCVESDVTAVVREAKLQRKDSILYNDAFRTGSQAHDIAVVLPLLQGEQRISKQQAREHHPHAFA